MRQIIVLIGLFSVLLIGSVHTFEQLGNTKNNIEGVLK